MNRRRHLRGTGGGPPADELDDFEEKILTVLPEAVLEGIESGEDTMAAETIVQPSTSFTTQEIPVQEFIQGEILAEAPPENEPSSRKRPKDHGCRCSEELLESQWLLLQETKSISRSLESIADTLQGFLNLQKYEELLGK